MIWIALLFWAQGTVPRQVQRGEALFGERCTQCHALKGRGTAVGPDLSVMGRLPPRAIATAVRSTATQYVQTVTLKSGESFPGIPLPGDENQLQFYDVSKMPPELRQVASSDIKRKVSQDSWKHPPAIANYASADIADIVAYLRYAVAGSVKPVDPSDVE